MKNPWHWSPLARALTIEAASVAPPGVQRLVASDINFVLKAGSGLGIIGPSGSGKSSLARMLVGVWQPARGKIRLDGATLRAVGARGLGTTHRLSPARCRASLGHRCREYRVASRQIPQPNAIIAAAKAAGVHDLIVSMPEGYGTSIGEQGASLSAGQAQRIALARALYGDPFLVVLDEPNSNLDAEGDDALTRAILGVRARNGIVVVVAHRPSAIAGLDLILAMAQGRQIEFGPKDETLAKVLKRSAPAPLRVAYEMESATA